MEERYTNIARKYRKKPITVEAEQFFPTKRPFPNGVEQYSAERTESSDGTVNAWNGWRIKTLEGWLNVSVGDWIITGVKGEKYPCKPDIFLETYEETAAPNNIL